MQKGKKPEMQSGRVGEKKCRKGEWEKRNADRERENINSEGEKG